MMQKSRLSAAVAAWFSLAAGAASAADCDLAPAASQETFLTYWRGLGGEVGLEDEISTLLRRAGEGDPGVLDELRSQYEGPSFYSMAFSSMGSALENGNDEAAAKMLAAIDTGELDDDQKATYASILLGLGRADEADAMLAGVEGGRNLASNVSGAFLVHFVETLGLEAGLKRYFELDKNPAMGFLGASTQYQRAGDEKALRALLSSPLVAQSMPDSYMGAMVIDDIEEVAGEEAALAAIAASHAALAKGDPYGRKFNLPAMVEILAREGCSDACLKAAAEPIRAAAQDPATAEDWSEEWTRALAAMGDLPAAMERVDDARELIKPASERAAGRSEPSYVLPLIFPLPAEEKAQELAGLARNLLWAEATPEALRETIALAAPITDPSPWTDVVGFAVHATYVSDEARLAVREALVRATSPSCRD